MSLNSFNSFKTSYQSLKSFVRNPSPTENLLQINYLEIESVALFFNKYIDFEKRLKNKIEQLIDKYKRSYTLTSTNLTNRCKNVQDIQKTLLDANTNFNQNPISEIRSIDKMITKQLTKLEIEKAKANSTLCIDLSKEAIKELLMDMTLEIQIIKNNINQIHEENHLKERCAARPIYIGRKI